jgi:hypothetical protein
MVNIARSHKKHQSSNVIDIAGDHDSLIQHQQRLIQSLAALLKKEMRHHVQFFETHISWVLVAGNLAYKFKKAVRFDFIDASTLEARHFYCLEELRLNRRLAPQLYLDVVPITGFLDRPEIGGSGTPIEYAVKMQAFEQEEIWTQRIGNGLLAATEVDQLGEKIAEFHQDIARAPSNSSWATQEELHDLARDNLTQLSRAFDIGENAYLLKQLRTWNVNQERRLASTFIRRKMDGFVRECHGDLHSGNILTRAGDVQVFDCIDFNPGLRWIDVMNDIAFAYMDLRFQGLRHFAYRFLNRYLELTGDYEGLALLCYYTVQRALVRAKVGVLRMPQLEAGSREAHACAAAALGYLTFAFDCTRPHLSPLMITHGFSGCGKSTFAKLAVEATGAVRIRSDIERKRMQGSSALDRMSAPIQAGIYAENVTEQTYARLLALARTIIGAGIPVIVDAAFLKYRHRNMFRGLANELGVPFVIFSLHAGEQTLKKRIVLRQKSGKDPSDAGLDILAYQLRHHDRLTEDELTATRMISTETGIDHETVHLACESVMAS